MLNGRSGSLDASAWLPARTHVPCSRARRSNGAVVGPGMARADARKPASEPRYWTYSGSTTRSAPTAASAASAAARAMLSSTSSRASSWTRATRSTGMARWYAPDPPAGSV